MTRAEKIETVGIVQSLLALLLKAGTGASGTASAALNQAVGILSAEAETYLDANAIGAAIIVCFRNATAAGATYAGMGTIVTAVTTLSPSTWKGRAVAQAFLRCALIEQSVILAATTFTSRDDVEAMLLLVNTAFEPAEEYAADNREPVNYRALVTLHASVTRDLLTRARPLPKMVTFSVPRSVPSLVLANRFYGDASRAAELAEENQVAHPLFMPRSGRALSA